MRAIQFTTYGGPEAVLLGDAPAPHAAAGEVRVAVRAAAVNRYDVKKVSGLMSGGAPLTEPASLGIEGAGVVDEVGDGVTGVSVGDEVFGLGSGTQAAYAVLSSWAPKPPSVDWALAAAVGVAGETSERALRLLRVRSGQTLLVDGGSGGVGTVAVQLAVHRGIRVVASASEANHDYLRGLGAVPVRYGAGLPDRVREAAGGPVDAVFDVAGKTPAEDLVALVPEPALVVSIANFDAVGTGIRVTGGGADSRPAAALAEISELLAQGALTVPVEQSPVRAGGRRLCRRRRGPRPRQARPRALTRVDLTVSGRVFQWRGPSPYFFVAVPDEESDVLREWSFVSYGWGVIPVTARTGGTTWRTSLFPKDGRYLVPLKDAVRRAEGLDDGDDLTIRLTVTEP